MQMWGARDPFVIDPSKFQAVFTATVADPPPGDPPPFWVIVNVPPGLNGETISLLRNGDVIGKAVVTGDTVRIPGSLADGSRPSGQLQVSIEPDNSPRVVIDVKNEAPRAKTTLTGECSGGAGTTDPMFMTGHLSAAPPGSTVRVTYEHPSSETVHEETATTDANGNYETSYVGNRPGNWEITAHYAGTDQYEPSDSTTCEINSG